MNRRRVLLLGLDGATWRILDPMIEQGHLPHLAALRSSGAYGELRSTIPPVTAAAWTTFQTGLLPGNHGVFDFRQHDATTYETYAVSSRDVPSPTLWELASAAGKRIALVNVPLTYPPRAINGAMITGMLTPDLEAELTYPAALKRLLLQRVPEYRVLVSQSVFNLQGWSRYVELSERTVRARAQAFRMLVDEQVPDWDLAMLHFQETDTLQHAAYPWLDPSHPEFSASRYRKALSVYQAIDKEIGALVERFGDTDTLILALSDHGHHAVSRTANVNAALAEAGLLQLARSSQKASLTAAARAIMTMLLRLDRWNLNKRLLPRGKRRRLVEQVNNTVGIAWESTQAYMIHGWVYAYINVNLQGREPKGIVPAAEYDAVRQQAVAALRALRDPETGEPVVGEMLTREEAFPGVACGQAPDLVAAPNLGFEFTASLLQSSKARVRRNLWRRDHTGTHSMDGILLAHGSGVSPGSVQDAHLVDLFPTILAWLGMPIPAYAQGQVLQSLFQCPLDFTLDDAASLESYSSNPAFSPEDERIIEERLRSLGYM